MRAQILELPPVKSVSGNLTVPGSKSIANRALLLAALGKGTTQINDMPDGLDVHCMLQALAALRVPIECNTAHQQCVIQGQGRAFTQSEPLSLFLGNAGTAMRSLSAALCLGSGEYLLTGDARMQERPLQGLVDALCQSGAQIHYLKNHGYCPLLIHARGLWGGDIQCDSRLSSQFISALLMALPMAAGDTRIHMSRTITSRPYIDLTLRIMKDFGVVVEYDADYRTFYIKGNQIYQTPKIYTVEPDVSSASYFMAAGAIRGRVYLKGVTRDSIQGEIAFLDALVQMGAGVIEHDDGVEVFSQRRLTAIDIDANDFPDTAMTLAIVALFARGTTTIRGIYNWRVKETDRLAAMAKELKKIGAHVIEGKEYLQITPPDVFQTAEIETYQDHRIAMCFTLISLANIPITLLDPTCVNKTYPNFFQDWQNLCQEKVG